MLSQKPLLEHICGAGEMSRGQQTLRFPEDQIPFPAPKSAGSQLPATPAQGNPVSSSGLLKHRHTWHTDTIKIVKSSLKTAI